MVEDAGGDNAVAKDHQLACEIHKWETDAVNGNATSAHAPEPADVTPCRLTDRFLDLDTPPPIPNPLKKTQLAAAKRLEKELKMAKVEADTGVKKPKTAKGKKAKGDSKGKKDKKSSNKNKKKQETGDPKTKKAANGPLTEAMKDFVQARRGEGVSYREAMKQWRTSTERASIVNSFCPSEQKRRRYT